MKSFYTRILCELNVNLWGLSRESEYPRKGSSYLLYYQENETFYSIEKHQTWRYA